MKKLLFTTLLLGGVALLPAQKPTKIPATYKPVKTEMYRKGWIDFNKNGIKDIYEDPTATLDARIENLLGQMTLEEKTCQMVTLYGYKRVLKDALPTPEWKQQLWKDGMGAIDEHLNGFQQWGLPPSDNENVWPASRHAWALNEVQQLSGGGGQFLTVYSGTVKEYNKLLPYHFKGTTASDLRIVLGSDGVSIGEVSLKPLP